MLFDEKDLNVFYNEESRTYFKEILQCYYSQNYRATIVLLYSFVIFDLFIKLQVMAEENDSHAKTKLNELEQLIKNDEKYSQIENEIIDFFKQHSSSYFNRFIEDIEYLKSCRNKCAHLKVNDNSLYVPNDYQSRMLICSMYDNIFSVKAPFIMDLFSFVRPDIELYSSMSHSVSLNKLEESIVDSITTKYLNRLTYDSLKLSYRTFIKLLFVTNNEDCENNLVGLFYFAYTMTHHAIHNGYLQLFDEDRIVSTFNQIKIDLLQSSPTRLEALASLMINFPVIMDKLKLNNDIFNYLSNKVLSKPSTFHLYKIFFPREENSAYDFFKENTDLHKPDWTICIYETLEKSNNFDMDEYMITMANAIPTFNSFSIADSYTSAFIKLFPKISEESIKAILTVYKNNKQCMNRQRHRSDVETIKSLLQEREIEFEIEGDL